MAHGPSDTDMDPMVQFSIKPSGATPVVGPVVFAVVSSPELHSTWPGFLRPASSWLDLWPYCSFVKRHIILTMNAVHHNWRQCSTSCYKCSWFCLCVCMYASSVLKPIHALKLIARSAYSKNSTFKYFIFYVCKVCVTLCLCVLLFRDPSPSISHSHSRPFICTDT